MGVTTTYFASGFGSTCGRKQAGRRICRNVRKRVVRVAGALAPSQVRCDDSVTPAGPSGCLV
eukprot:1281983-Pyramimonas_sp.AAC.1